MQTMNRASWSHATLSSYHQRSAIWSRCSPIFVQRSLPLSRIVDTSRRLFRPIFCSLRSSGIPSWKILFSDPGYKKPNSHYDKIQFAFIKANLDGWYQPSSDRRTTFGDRAFPLLAKGPCCFSRNYSSTRSHRGKRMHGALWFTGRLASW